MEPEARGIPGESRVGEVSTEGDAHACCAAQTVQAPFFAGSPMHDDAEPLILDSDAMILAHVVAPMRHLRSAIRGGVEDQGWEAGVY